MSQSRECQCGEKHEGHLCVLHSSQQADQIKCLTDKPTVVCFSCGREVNAAENVCVPMAIEKK